MLVLVCNVENLTFYEGTSLPFSEVIGNFSLELTDEQQYKSSIRIAYSYEE